MPAAAVSTNVGGMGAHWSGATPPPADDERVGFIDDRELTRLPEAAEDLLHSSTQAFGGSARGAALIETLSAPFTGLVDRRVQVIPHACERLANGRLLWTGSDTVLGPLVGRTNKFLLLPEMLCQRVAVDRQRVVGAELLDLQTGGSQVVRARAVVVASDSLRTPQGACGPSAVWSLGAELWQLRRRWYPVHRSSPRARFVLICRQARKSIRGTRGDMAARPHQ